MPEQKPPCSCTVPLITVRFIQQARSSCQWALLCMSVSLWRRNIGVLWLFWRIATPLSHQTPITPRGSTSSGTSVYHRLCCVMLTRQTCPMILGLFHLPCRCPTDRRRVAVTESGVSLQARFSALLFLTQDQYNRKYLHCSLSLCNQRASSCVPVSHIRSTGKPFNR